MSATLRFALYHFEACPYCARVRSTIAERGLAVDLRDIRQNPAFREELVAGGGKGQVPCLRIEHDGGSVEWLYESADIIAYLKKHSA